MHEARETSPHLQWLRWVLALHWTVGGLLAASVVALWIVAPMPGRLVPILSLALVVFVYTAVGTALVRRWAASPDLAMAARFRRMMNALAAADVAVLVAAIHLCGGADAPALDFCCVPMVVYGSFLSRRDALAHLVLLGSLLAAVFVGQHAGWLVRTCLALPGYACGTGISGAYVAMRWVVTMSLALVAHHLTTFIGSHMRMQEEQARRLAEERGRMAELKGRFVTMASHELRTPLTVILGASDALARYGDRLGIDDQRRRLAKIRTHVLHMTSLLDDVLTVGRAEAGRVSCTPQPTDVAALCREIAEELGSVAGTTHTITFASHLATPTLAVDPKLLTQILRNLVGNAIKYSPAGGRVAIDAWHEADALLVRVADEGIGIAPDDQRHLFEPFQRGANVGTIPGTGLGLAITKRLAETHGGGITVESAPGEGTRFTVTLRSREPVGQTAAA